MKNILIVSSSEKSISFFSDVLRGISCSEILLASTCGRAKQLLCEKDFDLCVINSPLSDESGESIVFDTVVNKASQIIFIVSAECYGQAYSYMEDFGVTVISRPINKNHLTNVLSIIKVANKKITTLKTENDKLMKKIEDIRVIDRAKCILISYYKFTEHEAHKYLERQSMDMRVAKRLIAESILKTYERRDVLGTP